MKKNQKKSNLGKLVLTCENLQDLHRQLQDDTELLGKMISGLMTNVMTTILACVTELAERDDVNYRDIVVGKYDAWLELYRRKNKEKNK